MTKKQLKQAQAEYIPGWIDAMRFGMVGGRPFSELSVQSYTHYTEWFLRQYGCLSVENLKKVLLAVPIDHFGKRYGVNYHNSFSLLKAIGYDCADAVSLHSVEERIHPESV